MAGGGARRGTLVIHCVAGHRRPLLDRGSPETGQGPAVANPRIRVWSTVVLSCRPLPCATAERSFASEPIGRRTLVPSHLETGHESVIAAIKTQLSRVGYTADQIRVTQSLRTLRLDTHLTEAPIEDRYASYVDGGNEIRKKLNRDEALALLSLGVRREFRYKSLFDNPLMRRRAARGASRS